ncbi:unnamed protein product, partial [Prorocentrum cordatum]
RQPRQVRRRRRELSRAAGQPLALGLAPEGGQQRPGGPATGAAEEEGKEKEGSARQAGVPSCLAGATLGEGGQSLLSGSRREQGGLQTPEPEPQRRREE